MTTLSPPAMFDPSRLFAIPGIEAPTTGDISEWHKVSERTWENNGWGTADFYEYHAAIWTRGFKQAQYVADVAACLWERRNIPERRHLVAHSNGCAIALAALMSTPELYVDEVHLFAGAVDGDYNANGLNALFARGQVGRVVWYCSESDGALKWAKWTRWVKAVASSWAYGYGGLSGPTNMAGDAVRGTLALWFPKFGHSSYFQNGRLPQFLAGIYRGEPVSYRTLGEGGPDFLD